MSENELCDDTGTTRFRYLPSRDIDTIVTSQSESNRHKVEALLMDNGVSYRNLVMKKNNKNVMTIDSQVKFKVETFVASTADLFVEFNSYQFVEKQVSLFSVLVIAVYIILKISLGLVLPRIK